MGQKAGRWVTLDNEIWSIFDAIKSKVLRYDNDVELTDAISLVHDVLTVDQRDASFR